MRLEVIEDAGCRYDCRPLREDVADATGGRKYCGGVSILSNPPMYRYYRIGIDTFAITTSHTTPHSYAGWGTGTVRETPLSPRLVSCKVPTNMY